VDLAPQDIPQPTIMILQVEGITKRFGGLVAVNDVSLNIREGEIWGLIGPNGAGKSTLLNVIAGVYKPEIGSVYLDGKKISGLTPEKICRLGIARTFQICRPFPKMTALENVLVAATFGNPKKIQNPQSLAREILDYVEFPMPVDTQAVSFNTAQLRRLDLARALASQPKLVLLDEAAAGLTPNELADLQSLILKIRAQGVTFLIVEHLMRLIMQLCDHIAVLHYGKKIAEGTPQEIQDNEEVSIAYLGQKPSQVAARS
jgi:branched-chain amino acid transport system ATP-binding protein